jgi:tetratricopeptide (TPR) repeat protein
MAALHAAVEHGRAGAPRRRRLALSLAAIGAIGGLGWAAWPAATVDTTSPCEAARAGLDEVWNPERAAGLRAAFTDTGRGSTGIERVVERVELFAERWRDGAFAACERARTRGEISEGPTDVLALPSRAMGCYRDARVQLDAVLAALPEAKAAGHAVILVQALPPLTPCEIDAPGPALDLGAGREAAEALARATAANAMRDGDATREHLARARAALDEPTTPNLAARLHLLEASDLYNRGELEASRQAARRGLDTAEAGDDPTDEVFAWLHLADAARALEDLDAAEFYVDRAHARAARGGDPPWLRARIDLGRAAVASLRGDHLAAYESFVLARDRLAEVYGTESSSYARILGDAALAARQAGRFGEAIAAGTEAVAVCGRVFGDTHAETVRAKVTLASMLGDAGDFARAIELFEEASAQALETDDLGVGDRFTYLVLHAQALGNARRYADAQARIELAAEVGRSGGLPPERIDAMLALLRASFALDAGDHALVIATLDPLRDDPPGESEHARRENGITICLNLGVAHARSGDASSARAIADDCRRRLGELEVRDPVRHGSAYRYLGEIEHRAGRVDEARKAYAEAIAMLESDGSAPLVAGEAHLGLAEVLLDASDHAGATEHLARARTAAAEAGAGEDQLAVEAFAARLRASASP